MYRLRQIPLVFLLLTVGPIALGLGYAGLYSLGIVGLLGSGFTFSHWSAVLKNAEFWWSLGFSAGVAGITILLSTTLSLMAVLRWRDRTLRGLRAYVFYIPLAIPATVMAFLIFQWLGDAGLLSRLAYQLHLTGSTTDFPTLINDQYGIGIIAAHLLMATPFLVIFFSNLYLSERVTQLRDLAATLGLTPGATARRLIVPLLLRQGRATLLLYGIFVFSSYEIPLLLGSQSPAMVSILAIRKLQRYNLGDIPQAYVISVLYAVCLLAVLLLWLVWSRYRAIKIIADEK